MSIGTMSTTQPIRAAKVRTGDLIIADGTNQPLRWDGVAGSAWATGVAAPTTAPGIIVGSGKTITNAVTDGGLIKITSTSHGFNNGDQVSIVGVTGTTEANGVWTLTSVTTNNFDLLGSVFTNAYGSGGTATKIGGSAGSLITITAAAADTTLIKITTSGAHGFNTGDQVYITGVKGTTEANGVWTVSLVDSTHFDLVGSQFVNAYTSGGTAIKLGATLGTYSFAYRYTDTTAATDHFPGGVPSNLSPITTVKVNYGDTFSWKYVDVPATRGAYVELWRTTAGQTTTYYLVTRLAKGAGTTFTDSLSDTAITTNNPNLSGVFAPSTAMAFLQPDGTPNAMRFVPPPSDAPYIIVEQDRVLMAGQQGQHRNTIIFSEPDEPESMPTTNRLTVQENTGDDDEVTGLARHGMRAYLLKERHLYSVQWIRQPEIDGACFLVADRGAISDRVWTWFEGYSYVMDTAGIYRFDGSRETKPISEPIQDLWRSNSAVTIDFTKSKWFWSSYDPARRFVTFYVAFSGDSGTRARRALVYHVDSGIWDVDVYSQDIGGGALYKLGGQSQLFVGANDTHIYLTGSGLEDGATPITYKHKSGMLEYPLSESRSKREFLLSYQPTAGTNHVNMQIFRGYEASPLNMNIAENLGIGITSAPGDPNIVMDITLTRSAKGNDPGYKKWQYHGSLDDRSQDWRYLTFYLTGTQSTDQITIFDYAIQGSEANR